MKKFIYLFFKSFKDVAPLIAVIIFFQIVVIGEPFANPGRMLAGVFLVVFGLFLFMRGLEAGLFPLGESMAFSFADKGNIWWLLIFAASIGYSTTIAEPALMAIAQQAEQITDGEITAFTLRNIVAIGVALGISVGTLRIILGHPFTTILLQAMRLYLLSPSSRPRRLSGWRMTSGASPPPPSLFR